MNIIIFTKRQYMNRDIIDDEYWKFHELPTGLSKRGHQVTVLCLSYRKRNEGEWLKDSRQNGEKVNWISLNIGRMIIPGLVRYIWTAIKRFKISRPDIIVGTSDSIYAILAVTIGKFFCIPVVIENYDNYEGFISARIPGVRLLFRASIRNANAVICHSQTLLRYINTTCGKLKHVVVIVSGIDHNLFHQYSKGEARERLGLSNEFQYIGIAGTLDQTRALEVVIEALRRLEIDFPKLKLLLAGTCRQASLLTANKRIQYMGQIPHQDVPYFINSLDLVIVPYKKSLTGDVSYPTRVMEAIACKRPFVCANLGDFSLLLGDRPEFLYQWDSPQELAEKINYQLKFPCTIDLPLISWEEYSRQFEKVLNDVCLNC